MNRDKNPISVNNVCQYNVLSENGGIIGILFYRVAAIKIRDRCVSEEWREVEVFNTEEVLHVPMDFDIKIDFEGPVGTNGATSTLRIIEYMELARNSTIVRDKKQIKEANEIIDSWCKYVDNDEIWQQIN